MHCEHEDWPDRLWKVPVGHGTQEPAASAYLPCAQIVTIVGLKLDAELGDTLAVGPKDTELGEGEDDEEEGA